MKKAEVLRKRTLKYKLVTNYTDAWVYAGTTIPITVEQYMKFLLEEEPEILNGTIESGIFSGITGEQFKVDDSDDHI